MMNVNSAIGLMFSSSFMCCSFVLILQPSRVSLNQTNQYLEIVWFFFPLL
jgi:hypothetical protein